MKMKYFCLLLILFFLAPLIEAQESKTYKNDLSVPKEKDFSLGLIIGSPTGATAKYWTSRRNAIDFALGTPFDSDVNFHFSGDYLWHFPILANLPGDLPFYTGFGARLRSINKPKESTKIDFGPRLPIGIAFLPTHVPLEFFAEIGLVVVFIPKGELNIDGGVGLRYRFGG